MQAYNEDSLRTHARRIRDATLEGPDELGGYDYGCNGLPCDQNLGCPCDGLGAGQATETEKSSTPSS